MFSKGGSFFSRKFARHVSNHSQQLRSEQWFRKQLDVVGLTRKISPEQLKKTLPTAKVYFNKQYITDPHDYLLKVPAVNVAGDKGVVYQDGTPHNGGASFFAKIAEGHPEFLSPRERLRAAKKIISSNSIVFANGGYPIQNAKQSYANPFQASIFSIAGATFEVPHQHLTLFTLDQHNPSISKETPFQHLYDGVPMDFEEAKRALGKFETSAEMVRVRLGLTLLGRSSSGIYHPTFSREKAIIFLTKPYFRHQLEDVSMLLSAVNASAQEAGKPALLKATAVGMGFFAKVDGSYEIQNLLFPYYLRAYKKLLQEQDYPWIGEVEFPIFDEVQQSQFEGVFEDYKGPVKVYQSSRDALKFTNEEIEKYAPSVVNPSDTFAYCGNEWGYGSVEAMIGLNSSLRFDQNPYTNPLILDPEHQVSVSIDSDFSAALTKVSDLISNDRFRM